MTKAYPILFSGEMVRAILDGRKTQTRRLAPAWRKRKAGDLLWVRETWETVPECDELRPSEIAPCMVEYRATERDLVHPVQTWRPSIFMPRWASRITLRVLDVRAEELQSITYEEIAAEGVEETAHSFARLWDGINDKDGCRWADNPEVTVVRFEVQP